MNKHFTERQPWPLPREACSGRGKLWPNTHWTRNSQKQHNSADILGGLLSRRKEIWMFSPPVFVKDTFFQLSDLEGTYIFTCIWYLLEKHLTASWPMFSLQAPVTPVMLIEPLAHWIGVSINTEVSGEKQKVLLYANDVIVCVSDTVKVNDGADWVYPIWGITGYHHSYLQWHMKVWKTHKIRKRVQTNNIFGTHREFSYFDTETGIDW